MAAEIAGLVSRLEAVTTRLESVASSGGGSSSAAAPPEALAAFVQAYDDIVSGSLAEFLSKCNAIGGDVKKQGDMISAAFQAQRDFILKVSKAKEPGQGVLVGLLQPTSSQIQAIQEFREKNRGSPFFNHLSAISEAIPALGWVTVSPAPGPFVKEMADAGQFYSNRVLKEFRDKDKTHVEWTRAWIATLTELQAYIKQNHTTGLVWNKQGVDVSSLGSAAPARGAPPPPPPGPPPPPMPMGAPTQSAGDEGDDRNALFAELNKGADITKGLKKVTDDMKTHKNPNLRQGPQPFKASPTSSHKSFKPFGANATKQEVAKPAKVELEGKKWIVEYQNGNKDIIIDQTNIKQTIYIYKCVNSTIQVKGKVNSIVIDGCKKTAVVFDDLVSALEAINCQSVQAQVTGMVPIVSIEKTDGFMIYLSKDSAKSEIISAKSSEMNILIPDSSGEFKEYAVPEQFKTSFDGKKLVTDPTDIAA